jgi:hypothetical protein
VLAVSATGLGPPNDVPGLPRYQGWVRRTFPLPGSTGVKIAQAPWKDAEDLAGHSDWVKLAAERGRSDANIHYHMVHGLVDEIFVAAGGIEREIRALKTAQAFAEAYAAVIPDPVPRPELRPMGVAPTGAAIDAAYATMNALTWIRTVQERVQRDDPGDTGPWWLRWLRRSKLGRRFGLSQPTATQEAGLLASLKGGEPKATIGTEFKRLLPKLRDARKFDNYVLHGGAVHGGGTPVFRMLPDRTVYFPFPDDPNTKRFFTWEQFTYEKERDALSYIEDQFDAIGTFIDSMLDAFDALP